MPTPIEILLDPISLIILGIYGSLMLLEGLVPGRKLPQIKNWKLIGILSFITYFYLASYLPLIWDEFFFSYQLFQYYKLLKHFLEKLLKKLNMKNIQKKSKKQLRKKNKQLFNIQVDLNFIACNRYIKAVLVADTPQLKPLVHIRMIYLGRRQKL